MGSPLRSPAPFSAGTTSAQRLFGSFVNTVSNAFAGSPQPAHSSTVAHRFGSQSQTSQSSQVSQPQLHSHSDSQQSQSQEACAAAAVVSAPSPAVKQEYRASQQDHGQLSHGSIGARESSAYGALSHATGTGYGHMRTPSGALTHGSYTSSTPNGAQSSGRGIGSQGRDAESAQECKGTPEMIDLT